MRQLRMVLAERQASRDHMADDIPFPRREAEERAGRENEPAPHAPRAHGADPTKT